MSDLKWLEKDRKRAAEGIYYCGEADAAEDFLEALRRAHTHIDELHAMLADFLRWRRYLYRFADNFFVRQKIYDLARRFEKLTGLEVEEYT